jgi:hypothetical protein
MSTTRKTSNPARAAKLNEKRLKLRQQYWPDVADEALWVRHGKKGFITIPRTMPLILSLMDDMSKNKPLSAAYLALWCRTFDDCMVTIASPALVAFESGFTGQRAVQTWTGRMKKLEELGFIMAQPGASGPYSHVLLINPYLVIKKLKSHGAEKIVTAKLNALIARASEIGADDLVLTKNTAA